MVSVEGAPPLELGYQWLDYKSIQMITVQFLYKYDPKKGTMRVLNDASRYTISDFSWELLEENACYAFAVRDHTSVELKEDPITKQYKATSAAIPTEQQMGFDYDVGRTGELVRRPLICFYIFAISFSMAFRITKKWFKMYACRWA